MRSELIHDKCSAFDAKIRELEIKLLITLEALHEIADAGLKESSSIECSMKAYEALRKVGERK
jgi:hypothetical protein